MKPNKLKKVIIKGFKQSIKTFKDNNAVQRSCEKICNKEWIVKYQISRNEYQTTSWILLSI